MQIEPLKRDNNPLPNPLMAPGEASIIHDLIFRGVGEL